MITRSGTEGGGGFYQNAMRVMQTAGIPYLVGGAYALREYTGVVRDTKDFDVFIRPADVDAALGALGAAGYVTGIPFPHWLAKAHHGEFFMDLVYRAGNGLCEVDERWFERGHPAELLGVQTALVPPEFMIWQKAYIMERERYDGADVAHLVLGCGSGLDWTLLLDLFGPDWRVLLSHLVMFGFVYPDHRWIVPAEVLDRLESRLQQESEPPHEVAEREGAPRCRGTLVSRQQYLPDVERWGFQDARAETRSRMSAEDIRTWTAAIGKDE